MLKNFLPFLLLLSLHSAQGAGTKAPPGKARLGDNAELAALAQKAKAPVPDFLEIQQEQAIDQAVLQRRQERYQERLEAKRQQDLTALRVPLAQMAEPVIVLDGQNVARMQRLGLPTSRKTPPMIDVELLKSVVHALGRHPVHPRVFVAMPHGYSEPASNLARSYLPDPTAYQRLVNAQAVIQPGSIDGAPDSDARYNALRNQQKRKGASFVSVPTMRGHDTTHDDLEIIFDHLGPHTVRGHPTAILSDDRFRDLVPRDAPVDDAHFGWGHVTQLGMAVVGERLQIYVRQPGLVNPYGGANTVIASVPLVRRHVSRLRKKEMADLAEAYEKARRDERNGLRRWPAATTLGHAVEAGRPTLAAPAPPTAPAADEASEGASAYTPRTLEKRVSLSEIDAIIAERQAAREAQSSGGATSESEDTATSDDESAGSDGSDGAGAGAGAGARNYPHAARGHRQRQGAHAQIKRMDGRSRKDERRALQRSRAPQVHAVDPAEIARASEERRLTQLPPDQRLSALEDRLEVATRQRLSQGLPHLHAPTLQRLLDRERERVERERELRQIQEERERVEQGKLAKRAERKRQKDLERQQKRQEAFEREQARIQSAIEAEAKSNENAGLEAKDAEIPRFAVQQGSALDVLDFLSTQQDRRRTELFVEAARETQAQADLQRGESKLSALEQAHEAYKASGSTDAMVAALDMQGHAQSASFADALRSVSAELNKRKSDDRMEGHADPEEAFDDEGPASLDGGSMTPERTLAAAGLRVETLETARASAARYSAVTARVEAFRSGRYW